MRRIAALVAILVTLLSSLLSPFTPSASAADRECFDKTGFCIEGRFKEYWHANGGLEVFGYPITAPAYETNSSGDTVLTQWFERNRFESHPGNKRPYDVLLGRIGAETLTALGRPVLTNVRIHPEFIGYWSSHGLDLGQPGTTYDERLALFGLPISEATMETNSSGDTVLTQWFERARFELHGYVRGECGRCLPNVLLGLLGRECPKQNAPAPAPQPAPQPAPPANCQESELMAVSPRLRDLNGEQVYDAEDLDSGAYQALMFDGQAVDFPGSTQEVGAPGTDGELETRVQLFGYSVKEYFYRQGTWYRVRQCGRSLTDLAIQTGQAKASRNPNLTVRVFGPEGQLLWSNR